MTKDNQLYLDTEMAKRPVFNPSRKEAEWIRRLNDRFTKSANQRRRAWDFIANRSINRYFKDMEQRWLALPFDGEKESWQSRASKPVTRQKCQGIIAHTVDMFLRPSIHARGKVASRRLLAQIMEDMVDISNDKDRFDSKAMNVIMDAVIYGTGFLQQDYVCHKRKVKLLENDFVLMGDDGEPKYKEKTLIDFEGPRSQTVSPYDVYLGDIFTFDIQEQPYIFRRRRVPFKQAELEFGHFPNFKYVNIYNRGETDGQVEDSERFASWDSLGIEADLVEVLYYQCRADDEIAIIINGVPMTKQGTPIPYNHKDYNLIKVVYSKHTNNVAYGKGLPDVMMHEQDAIDTLYRMVIDKTYINAMKPLLITGNEFLTEVNLRPGGATVVDEDTSITEMPGIGALGNEINVLMEIERSMSRSSLDDQQLGIMATGERNATQVLAAKEGAMKILGLFAHMMADFVYDVTKQRIALIGQFWTRKERFVHADADELLILQGEFIKEDTKLDSGVIGSRIIRFMEPEEIPSSQEIAQMEMEMSLIGEPTEIVYLDPQKFKDLELFVKIAVNPSDRMSPALQKAMSLEFYDRFINNPMIEPTKLTRETILELGKNPADYMAEPQQPEPQQQAMGEEAMMTEGGPQLSSQRGMNVASNMAAMAQPDIQSLIQQ